MGCILYETNENYSEKVTERIRENNLLPKLLIIDQAVSAGGVERFLHGLVGGMLELPEVKDWDITILLNRYNSGGYKVEWPEHLKAPNVHLHYMFDDKLSRLLNWMSKSGRVLGIYGTSFAKSRIPWLLRKYGTPWLRSHAGDAQLWIEHFCRQQHFDVAYFSYPYLMECPRVPMPMVATPHDFNWKRFSAFWNRCWYDQIERQMPEWLHRCHRLVVSSEFMASELRYFYPDAANKVSVLRLGIPGGNHIPTNEELQAYKQRRGLPEQFLLTVGWIIPHKNQRVLFEALGQLRSKGVNIPLVFTGPHSDKLQPGNKELESGYFKEISQVAERLNLQYGRDYWGLGYVDDFELECLYRLATALILPSLYEAGSFPLVEATRARCPVACSQIPAHVEHDNLLGNNMWLFDPYDADKLANTIVQMIQHPQLAKERAMHASEKVTEVYSWQKTGEGYLSVFREALADNATAQLRG